VEADRGLCDYGFGISLVTHFFPVPLAGCWIWYESSYRFKRFQNPPETLPTPKTLPTTDDTTTAKKATKSRRAALSDDDDDTGDQGAGGSGYATSYAGTWDWEWGRAAVLRALQLAMAMDLRALYGGVAGVERMAGLALEVVRRFGVGGWGCRFEGFCWVA